MTSSSELRLTVAKLNSENYQLWKFKVEMLLSKDDLWEVITTDRPDDNNQTWDKKNRQARATISLLVEDDQLIHIRNDNTAKGMWEALRKLHERSSLNHKLFLLRKLYKMRLSAERDMQEHINSMMEVITQLRSIGEDIKESHVAAILLCSLPDSYTALINALETRPEADLTLEFVKTRLIDEYQRRKEQASDSSGKDSETALKITEKQSYTTETRDCFRCKKKGHLKKDCSIWKAEQQILHQKRNKQAVKSTIFDPHADNWKGTFKVSDKRLSSSWFIDSGATSHMTSNKNFFTELDLNKKEAIYLADGSKITAEGIGQGMLIFTNSNILVKDVLYVPELEGGLLSVKRLTAKGLTVEFKGDECTILAGGKVIINVKAGEHLYHLDTVKEQMMLCTHDHKNCIHMWHRRLGHRHPESILALQKKNLTKDLLISDCSITVRCECCIKCKATRVSIPKESDTKSTRPLDLVHTDVCGPMKVTTSGGNRYLVTFIDDYSRYTVTYLIKNKSEVINKLIEYVTKVNNKFQRKPIIIRSDNGGEFTGHQVENYLKQNGIEHQKTVPYTPEQNGVAERKNRTLTEMIRCMLTDSKLPEKYWGEAAITATYLQNRLFSRKLKKTPYELWQGKKPSVDHLRVFGCKVFVFIPEEKRSKLQNRAIEGIFVGYSENCKGYRILDPKTDRITISNSVTFIEDLNDDIMTSLETKNEKNNDEVTAGTSDVKEVEIDKNQNTESEEIQIQTDTEPRRSIRENKGKPPIRLSYKASTNKIYEPISWDDISQLSKEEANKWINAAETEIKSMHDLKTWTLTELPKGRKAIGCKWVFKVKYQTDGTAERYRARLVAKGYAQKYGEDYDETFAPVVKHTTVRTLFAVAATKKMQLKHLDIKTAFLNGDLTEDIYMEQPPGFKDKEKPNMVCKLQKSIYGLKQAAKTWNDKISEVLINEHFQRSKADPCLYTKRLMDRWIYVLIYVDDILVCFEEERDAVQIMKILDQHFEIKDLGNVKQYLGIQIEREEDGSFTLNQSHLIQDIIETFGLKDAKPVKSPMETNYLKGINSEKNMLPDNEQYRKAMGKLLYLSTITRPDIATAVGILSRKVSKPNKMDWNAVKRVIRYLKGTSNVKLKLPASDKCILTGYVDADWAGDPIDRKSTSGYLFLLSGGPISWTSKKQSIVTLSSTEAEYVAAAQASQEVLWLRQLLTDLGEQQLGPTKVHEDNQGCLILAQMEKVNSRTKHIDVKFHFLREHQEQGTLKLEYCPTEDMTADIFTKALSAERHQRLMKKLGLN